MATSPLFSGAQSSNLIKFWIPGIFLLTVAALWGAGTLSSSFVSTFLPHGFCYLWNPKLLWMHLISDAIIALSYLAISTSLTVLVVKARGDIPFSWMFLSFGAFIVACGATHLMEVFTLWFPVYWLSANVKVVTAVASLTTAVVLPPMLPSILGVLRSARLSEGRRLELEKAQAVLEGEVEIQGQTLDKLVQDIAARNRELEDSRQRLYVTLRSIGDAVITTNAEGRITFMNGVAELLTGWKVQEAEGRELTEVFRIVNEYSREPVENPVDKVRQSGGIVGLANHTVLVSREGRDYNIDDSGAPIMGSSGQLTGVILIFRDITERRRAEEARLLLASIVDSSEDAIVSRDLSGTITSWNRAAADLYGYTAEEAIGQPASLTIPASVEKELVLAREMAKKDQPLRRLESKRVAKDGRVIDVSITASPVYNYTGELVGTATIAHDISLQKQTEDALRTSEKLAATGRLAATIAHEINNPLEAVMNLVYLIEAESSPYASLHSYAAKAQEELRRVAHITRQTLAFYRDTSRPHEVDLYEVATGIFEIYQREVHEKSITVHLNIAMGLKVEGFPGELRQVFSNLIRNAIEALPAPGGIWIEGAKDADGFVHVSVTDSGPGVPAEDQRRIFEPFYTTKGVNGTGLGLWVSQGIVQKHGGTLVLSSPPMGRKTGAEFTVRLPIKFGSRHPDKS
jgi:PAS domain S-box-containing protein